MLRDSFDRCNWKDASRGDSRGALGKGVVCSAFFLDSWDKGIGIVIQSDCLDSASGYT